MTAEADPATDTEHMRAALALAGRALGNVWPNPAVGCVIVKDGCVVGRGWTQPGGRPHAETEAIRRAGEAARGATLYVSLEPCDHHGVTPPCSEAVIAAGIARVVVAAGDPDPRVSGRGLERLRGAGLQVITGVLETEAADLNAGFFLRVTAGRPLFTLKVASSLDGRIAARSGDSRWITGDVARGVGHGLRADNDAVLIGSGTALTDDPELTCRLPGLEDRSLVRVVADGRLRLPPTAKLAVSADATPTWVITRRGADLGKAAALGERGVTVIEVEEGDGAGVPAAAVARCLGERGLTRVLIEGGGTLAASFLAADLVDRLAWFRAPAIIGGDGIPAVAALALDRVQEAPRFVRTDVRTLGADTLETFVRTR